MREGEEREPKGREKNEENREGKGEKQGNGRMPVIENIKIKVEENNGRDRRDGFDKKKK